MTERRGGLGRGLAALIPSGPAGSTSTGPRLGAAAADVVLGVAAPRATDATGRTDSAGDPDTTGPAPGAELAEGGATYRELPPGEIRPNPRQPRQVFDDDALDELVFSIREFGLMQPVVVREISPAEDGVRYELVMGERRWRATQAAGLATIPAIVRETTDDAMLRDALLENIHRVQLNPLEEAAAYQQLLEEFGVTHDELASRIGRSRPVVSNTIRLLKLPVAVQRRVAVGVLSAGHARALLALDGDSPAQDALATRIVAEGLSVRATEEAVTVARSEGPPPAAPSRRRTGLAPELREVADRLSDTFDTRVTVTQGQRKGKIVVEFGSTEDLERIVALMQGPDRG
ncbi:ParB/RepB/Spo0J family partition protein [Rhodococcus aerolatus]